MNFSRRVDFDRNMRRVVGLLLWMVQSSTRIFSNGNSKTPIVVLVLSKLPMSSMLRSSFNFKSNLTLLKSSGSVFGSPHQGAALALCGSALMGYSS